jgi:hypothetical protein
MLDTKGLARLGLPDAALNAAGLLVAVEFKRLEQARVFHPPHLACVLCRLESALARE